jgi:hypothetical protein
LENLIGNWGGVEINDIFSVYILYFLLPTTNHPTQLNPTNQPTNHPTQPNPTQLNPTQLTNQPTNQQNQLTNKPTNQST